MSMTDALAFCVVLLCVEGEGKKSAVCSNLEGFIGTGLSSL